MRGLTLDSLNDILVNAGGIGRKELLEVEIQAAYTLKIQMMEKMVELSNAGEDFAEVLQTINNIDCKLDRMKQQLDELQEVQE